MNQKELDATIDTFVASGRGIIAKKNHDYASDEDALGNFKRVGALMRDLRLGEILNTNPALGASIAYILLKIDRLSNLTIEGVKPSNESKKDNWLDLLNYVTLAYACDQEGITS